MANQNESAFNRKFKQFCTNRAVVVTVITLLAALSIVLAVTVAANRANRPSEDPAVGSTVTTAAPVTEGVTLPAYHEPETKPVIQVDPDEPTTPAKPIFALPAEGKLFKGHDTTLQVYSNTMGDYRVHLGLDITTDVNAPVSAAADGKIEKVWNDAMMGTCVAVDHGNKTVSIYKNLAKDLAAGIEAGAEVKAGQELGHVGDTAVLEMADEPHLHYEMTVNGLSVNPLDYFAEEAVHQLTKGTDFETDAAETTRRPVDGK